MRSIWIGIVIVCLGALPGFAFAQAEGILEVKVNTSGASVYIDGQLRGQAPLMEVVSAGYHELRVEHPSFESHEERVLVSADTSVEFTATLTRIKPGVSISVDVPGARVFLDGRQVGVGDVLVDPVRPGRHTLVVETEGFGRYEARINVPDARLTPVAVSMQGSLGVLVVRSDPKGAMVIVDGEEVGLTPVTIQPIAPGSHGIELVREGYSRVLRKVDVDPGQRTVIDSVMAVEGGRLEIRTNPKAARVAVNGVDLGSERRELGLLKPGSYALRVSAPGHLDFIRSVRVENDRNTRVVARLKRFGTGGGTGPVASASLPVHQRPAFWVGVGAGTAAAVSAIIAGVVASSQPGDPPPVPGTPAPSATFTFALP
ncbi:MAG: PEGA domain-containing protein [Myxococcota bacterium]|nr:PEGA domain-containing protein [Myxococcota bacterium]